jgi:hypothetical protein
VSALCLWFEFEGLMDFMLALFRSLRMFAAVLRSRYVQSVYMPSDPTIYHDSQVCGLWNIRSATPPTDYPSEIVAGAPTQKGETSNATR